MERLGLHNRRLSKDMVHQLLFCEKENLQSLLQIMLGNKLIPLFFVLGSLCQFRMKTNKNIHTIVSSLLVQLENFFPNTLTPFMHFIHNALFLFLPCFMMHPDSFF